MIPVGDYVSRENEVDHRQAVRVSVGRMMRPQGYSDDTGAVSAFLDLLDGPRRPWHLQAACCQPGVQTAWFFPETSRQYSQYRDAKKVCAGCAVIAQCRTEHINEEFGCFFGTGPRERQHLRSGTVPRTPKPRAQSTAPHGTVSRAVDGGCRCDLCAERHERLLATRRRAAKNRRIRAKPTHIRRRRAFGTRSVRGPRRGVIPLRRAGDISRPRGRRMTVDLWWTPSYRADPRGALIADRHYNRQKIGAPRFVPPGRCLVFRHADDALWVTSWPYAEYVKHAWAGAWVNSTFRNESDRLASELIREAVAHTLAVWPEPPALGMVTMIDPTKVRHKRDPGRCYLKAGFHHAGWTKGGLRVVQLVVSDMPAPIACGPTQQDIFVDLEDAG